MIDHHILQTICQNLIKSSHQFNSIFINEGKDLGWIIFGIAISQQVWQIVVDDDRKPMTTAVKIIATSGFLFFLLTHWESVVADFFFNKINLLAKKINPDIDDNTLSILLSILHQISQKSFLSDFSSGPFIAATLGNLGAIILKTATEIIITLTMTAYIIVLYMGNILLSISMMLGPLLCPWMIFPSSRFLFDGWLRLTISAALYQIVGSALSLLCRSSIEMIEKTTHSSLIPGYISPDQTILIFIMIICLVFLALFWQIPEVCRGIVNGSASLSSTHIRQNVFGGGSIIRPVGHGHWSHEKRSNRKPNMVKAQTPRRR